MAEPGKKERELAIFPRAFPRPGAAQNGPFDEVIKTKNRAPPDDEV